MRTPSRIRSTIGSASAPRSYTRGLNTQLVAISSRAPNRTFAASVGLIAPRKMRRAWPSSMTSRMIPRYSRSVRRREALHELRRLAQLDLEHDRQVAVGPEPLQVESCNAAKAGLRVEPFEGGSALRDSGLHGLLEDRDEQVVLAVEVEIHRAGGDARRTCDVGHLRVEEPVSGEGTGGGREDPFTLIGRGADPWRAHRAAAGRGCRDRQPCGGAGSGRGH